MVFDSDFTKFFKQIFAKAIVRFGERKFYWGMATLLTLSGYVVLLIPGIPAGHDLGFHLCRLMTLAQGFKHGVFPVWINGAALDGFGYGYGFFYSDIYLYLYALIVVCGVPILWAYKLFLLSVGLVGCWSMFFVVRKISCSYFGAFVATVLYSMSSYLATDAFTRAAIGEFTATMFMPWIILGVYEILYGDMSRFLPLSLGFAGLFYAHTISFVLTSIVVAIILLSNGLRLLSDVRRLGWLFLAMLWSIGLMATLIVSQLEQIIYLDFNLTGQTFLSPIATRVVPFTRLFLSIPYHNVEPWLPSGVGLIFVIVLVQRLRFKSHNKFLTLMILVSIFSLLAATNFLPWEGCFSLIAAIQFPWRFYVIATAFLAISGGLILGIWCRKSLARVRFWFIVVILGSAFAWWINVGSLYVIKHKEGNFWYDFSIEELNNDYAIAGQHYLPKGRKIADYRGRGGKVELISGGLSNYEWIPKMYNKAELNLGIVADKTIVAVPLIPYVGYCAEIDGVRVPISFEDGRFLLFLDNEFSNKKIKICYQNSELQIMGMIISVMSLIGVLIMAGLIKRRKKCLDY